MCTNLLSLGVLSLLYSFTPCWYVAIGVRVLWVTRVFILLHHPLLPSCEDEGREEIEGNPEASPPTLCCTFFHYYHIRNVRLCVLFTVVLYFLSSFTEIKCC